MKTLAQLREARVAAVEEAKKIRDAATAESRELTDEESAKVDELLDSADALASEIKVAETQDVRLSRLDSHVQALAQPAPRKIPVFQAAKPQIVAPVTGPRIEFGIGPTPRNFKGPNARKDAHDFGMWAMAVMGSPNATRYCIENGIDFEASVHVGGVNSLGGYLIPPQFDQTMIDLREQYGVFRRNCRNVTMTSDTLMRPRRTGGLTAYFIGETAAITESNKTWDQVQLVAKDVYCLSRFSGQLADDAAISVGDDLAGEIAYAFAYKEDLCGFLGDGTSTYGGIKGVRTCLAAATASVVTANSGTNTDWTQITLSEMNDLIGKLPQYADTSNVRWYCHKAFFANVMCALTYAAGGTTMSELQRGGARQFLGYPVEITQVMPASAASANYVCYLGDFNMAIDFGDRRQNSVAFSTDASVGGQSVFERNEIAVRGWERFDIVVHDVGDTSSAGPIIALLTAA